MANPRFLEGLGHRVHPKKERCRLGEMAWVQGLALLGKQVTTPQPEPHVRVCLCRQAGRLPSRLTWGAGKWTGKVNKRALGKG